MKGSCRMDLWYGYGEFRWEPRVLPSFVAVESGIYFLKLLFHCCLYFFFHCVPDLAYLSAYPPVETNYFLMEIFDSSQLHVNVIHTLLFSAIMKKGLTWGKLMVADLMKWQKNGENSKNLCLHVILCSLGENHALH